MSSKYVFLLIVLYSKVLSKKFKIFKLVLFCKSLMCIRNKRSPRTEPCNNSSSILSHVD